MKNIYFFTRNRIKDHIILKNIFKVLKDSNYLVNECNLNFDFKFKIANGSIIIVDDPIAFIYCYLIFFFKKNIRILFLSLEVFEHQLEWNKFYNIVRNFIFFVLQKISLNKANWVFFPNNQRLLFYLDKNPLLKSKSSVLQNFPLLPLELMTESDSQNISLQQVKLFVKKFKLNAIYAGSLASGRDINQIVSAFENQKFFGLIIISSNKWIDTDALNFETSSILYLNVLPHSIVQEIYKICQVGFLTYANNPINTRLCAPVKIFEYANQGLFILGNKNENLLQNELVHGFFDNSEDIFRNLESFLVQQKPVKRSFNIKNEVLEKLVVHF